MTLKYLQLKNSNSIHRPSQSSPFTHYLPEHTHTHTHTNVCVHTLFSNFTQLPAVLKDVVSLCLSPIPYLLARASVQFSSVAQSCLTLCQSISSPQNKQQISHILRPILWLHMKVSPSTELKYLLNATIVSCTSLVTYLLLAFSANVLSSTNSQKREDRICSLGNTLCGWQPLRWPPIIPNSWYSHPCGIPCPWVWGEMIVSL